MMALLVGLDNRNNFYFSFSLKSVWPEFVFKAKNGKKLALFRPMRYTRNTSSVNISNWNSIWKMLKSRGLTHWLTNKVTSMGEWCHPKKLTSYIFPQVANTSGLSPFCISTATTLLPIYQAYSSPWEITVCQIPVCAKRWWTTMANSPQLKKNVNAVKFVNHHVVVMTVNRMYLDCVS